MICQNFELPRLEEVYGGIAYYLADQAEIDSYLIRQSDKWAEERRNAEPLPGDLRQRLMRARHELHTARPSRRFGFWRTPNYAERRTLKSWPWCRNSDGCLSANVRHAQPTGMNCPWPAAITENEKGPRYARWRRRDAACRPWACPTNLLIL